MLVKGKGILLILFKPHIFDISNISKMTSLNKYIRLVLSGWVKREVGLLKIAFRMDTF